MTKRTILTVEDVVAVCKNYKIVAVDGSEVIPNDINRVMIEHKSVRELTADNGTVLIGLYDRNNKQ